MVDRSCPAQSATISDGSVALDAGRGRAASRGCSINGSSARVSDDECASGLCLGRSCGVCSMPSASGGPCFRDHDCAPGLLCPSSGLCGTISASGGACMDWRDCDVGLGCGTDGTCQTLYFPAATGASCVPPVYCSELDICDAHTQLCTPRVMTDCPCIDGQCATGQCVAGTCHLRPRIGEPCILADRCELGACTSGTCTLPPGTTTACAITEECPPREYCGVENACRTAGSLGESCGRIPSAELLYCLLDGSHDVHGVRGAVTLGTNTAAVPVAKVPGFLKRPRHQSVRMREYTSVLGSSAWVVRSRT